MFERWLVKTAINLLVARDFTVADGAVILEPTPEHLVRVAFGLESLRLPTGVYVAFHPNELLGPKDRMTVGVLADPRVALLGVLFSIQGFRFLLWLGAQAPPNPLKIPGIIEAGWHESHLYRHLSQLRWIVNDQPSHHLNFGWPDKHETALTLYV